MAAPVLIPYLIGTWLFAAAVSVYAEEPFRKWLRRNIDDWAARREAKEAAHRTNDDDAGARGVALETSGRARARVGALALEEGVGATALLSSQHPRSDANAPVRLPALSVGAPAAMPVFLSIA